MVVVTAGAGALTARLETGSADETRALAGAVAGTVTAGDVLLLTGDLGAGKTTFAQGFGRALGVVDAITSPTFVLVHHYECTAGTVHTLLHADLYRLDQLAEVADLGLGELVEDRGVALVEWGEAGAPVLGDGALSVTLQPVDPGDVPSGQGEMPEQGETGPDEHRIVTLSAPAATWRHRWPAVVAAVAPWGPPLRASRGTP
ncbi:MAG: tRNA (adenosine(37)-N6)-threonylcarbamoyltransferase complex ATPase subunit type 1 TsaE [Actinomycetota bacterium]|nr:tRNA (adenosine(37)-N6)-threonylcarbamoyltransferase complex ATPase subunit type 1 TsaE [Actinomycetota bacterium]